MIATGTLLGAYEILGLLGAGGMGEVYRARDTKLGRSVAIKVLPEALASDAERVARLEREAKVLASLNHPHIAALYGLENAEGRPFLIMELVEGETLADRIARGPLKVDEALPIAIQICEALETAHDQGIVHRDLKPANIKLTPDDKVKVLDFGLARAMETAPAAAGAGLTHSPTLSLMATQAGMILGTAAYMSPEQAKGQPADHRSDVFSFGCVLYEMLTGRQAFQGNSAPEILAAVLMREPDLFLLSPNLNPRLSELLGRCLHKQSRRRYQAIGDVRAELEAVFESPRTDLPVGPRRVRWWPILLTAAGTAAVTWGATTMAPGLTRGVGPSPVVRFAEAVPDTPNASPLYVALSRDGTSLAYIQNRRVYVRTLTEPAARIMAGDEPGPINDFHYLAFSPDGQALIYWSRVHGAIRRVSVAGGPSSSVIETPSPTGLTWTDDGILFDRAGVAMRVEEDGGEARVVASPQQGERLAGIQPVPGARAIVFSIQKPGEPSLVAVQPLDAGPRTVLVEGSSGRVTRSGHLLYVAGRTLFVQRFDRSALTVSGTPVAVVQGVRPWTLDVSDTGTLAYVPGPAVAPAGPFGIAVTDSNGSIEFTALPPGSYDSPRVSPDGRLLAYESLDGKTTSIWVLDLERPVAPRRLTFAGNARRPLWSHDGRWLIFESDHQEPQGLFRQPATGSTHAERLTTAAPGTVHRPEAWSLDGQTVLYHVAKDNTFELWMLSMASRRTAPLPVPESTRPPGAAFSPDGRWIAYGIRDKGELNMILYVESFPLNGNKFQITQRTDDAHHPLWSRDGKQLFLVPGPGGFGVVDVHLSPTFSASAMRRFVPALANRGPTSPRGFDVSVDGKLIGLASSELMESQVVGPSIQVVLNWFEELKAKVPVN